jgi:hypothetical protein
LSKNARLLSPTDIVAGPAAGLEVSKVIDDTGGKIRAVDGEAPIHHLNTIGIGTSAGAKPPITVGLTRGVGRSVSRDFQPVISHKHIIGSG